MNAKHTAGPWAVQNQGPACSISIIGPGIQSPFLAHVLPDECGGETVALTNARLIAAAPELLQALQACIADGFLAGEVLDQASTAIARATGAQS